jgi:hypothetical protein
MISAVSEPKRKSPLGFAQRLPWALPSGCVGAALYLYVNLFVFPRVPILLGGDQLYFWMGGQRMLYGELPYRDFLQFTPPGTDLFYFSAFKLFGPHIWVTNMVVLILGVALCGLCPSIAKQIMELDLALPATILFLTLIYAKLLNATHHWFSVLAILAAVRILLQEQSRARMFAAGCLLGLAGFFTQSHAAAAMLAFTIWLAWWHLRETQNWPALLADGVFMLLGFAITLGAVESYFIATIGWKQLWYFQVTYVWNYMVHGPETSFLGMPPWTGWRHFPSAAQYMIVYLLLPIAYVLALRTCWKGNSGSPEHRKKAMLVALTGTVLLCEVTFSLNWLRIYTISMPGFILLLWLVGQARDVRRVAVRVVWAVILFIAATQTFHARHRQYVIANLPAGWAAINPESYSKLQWIEERTRPGEFFFDAGWPGVYLPLRLRNPVFEDSLRPDIETRSEFVRRCIAELDTKGVHYILWSQRLDSQENYDPTNSLLPLRAYIHDHYRQVKVFADQDEIWERIATT